MNKKNFKKNQCCVQGFEAVRVWSSSGPINFFLEEAPAPEGIIHFNVILDILETVQQFWILCSLKPEPEPGRTDGSGFEHLVLNGKAQDF